MSDKVKIALIEPCTTAPYDRLIVRCDSETWREVVDAVESELDAQFCECEDNGDGWGGIEVKVSCREVTREWLSEHTED